MEKAWALGVEEELVALLQRSPTSRSILKVLVSFEDLWESAEIAGIKRELSPRNKQSMHVTTTTTTGDRNKVDTGYTKIDGWRR